MLLSKAGEASELRKEGQAEGNICSNCRVTVSDSMELNKIMWGRNLRNETRPWGSSTFRDLSEQEGCVRRRERGK